jgi:hypothetical protein
MSARAEVTDGELCGRWMPRKQTRFSWRPRGHACALCHEAFEDDQPICIDHDHACCPDEKSSCGKCVRGLLCLSCNTALGIIERKLEQARAYLDRPLAGSS